MGAQLTTELTIGSNRYPNEKLGVLMTSNPGLEQQLGADWERAIVKGDRLVHPDGMALETGFLGWGDELRFIIRHRPAGEPRGLIVVCSPPYREAIRNQKRELLFGWLAASEGLAVARFHPRGSGHSAGRGADVTMESMVDDALACADHAEEAFGRPVTGFIGTRLGAVVAHRAAAGRPGTAVAWWQPSLNAEAVFRELFRARIIGELKLGVAVKRQALIQEMQTKGYLDVLGSPVGLRFHDSVHSGPLDDAPAGPRRGLLVQMSLKDELHADYAAFVTALSNLGWDVTTAQFDDEETWWFGAQGRLGEVDIRARAMEIVPTTVSFFTAAAT